MNKALAWTTLCLALSTGAVSCLVGMAPNIVEQPDGRGDPINCGAALFHYGPRPSPLCGSEFDLWRLAAEFGLGLAAILLMVAFAFFRRAAQAG